MKLTTIVAEVKAKWYLTLHHQKHLVKGGKGKGTFIEQSFKLLFHKEFPTVFNIGCVEFDIDRFKDQAHYWGIKGFYKDNSNNDDSIKLYKYLQLEEFEKVVNWVAELPPIRTEIPRIQRQKQLTLFLKNHNRRTEQ